MNNSGDEELMRMVREGVRPEGLEDRIKFAVDSLHGRLPHGADAPSRTVRKAISGGFALAQALSGGFFGLMCIVLAAIAAIDIGNLALAGGFVLLGAWLWKVAWQAWLLWKTISRA